MSNSGRCSGGHIFRMWRRVLLDDVVVCFVVVDVLVCSVFVVAEVECWVDRRDAGRWIVDRYVWHVSWCCCKRDIVKERCAHPGMHLYQLIRVSVVNGSECSRSEWYRCPCFSRVSMRVVSRGSMASSCS